MSGCCRRLTVGTSAARWQLHRPNSSPPLPQIIRMKLVHGNSIKSRYSHRLMVEAVRLSSGDEKAEQQRCCSSYVVGNLGDEEGGGGGGNLSGDVASVIGKKEVKRAEVILAAAVTVALGVGNRVLYKLALVPLKHYPFFLAQLATFGSITRT